MAIWLARHCKPRYTNAGQYQPGYESFRQGYPTQVQVKSHWNIIVLFCHKFHLRTSPDERKHVSVNDQLAAEVAILTDHPLSFKFIKVIPKL